MKFISHRGAAGLAPENTLASIKLADTFEPVYIEIDVNETSDGKFVLYHGDARRTYQGIKLGETYDELAQRIDNTVTLRKILRTKLRSPLLIDVKVTSDVHKLIAEIKGCRKTDNLAFTSNHAHALKKLREEFPAAKTYISQPYQEGPYRPIELANMYDFTGVNINKWWVNPFTYYLCKRYKKELFCYTVKHRTSMRLIRRFFPNITIVTDYPDRIVGL